MDFDFEFEAISTTLTNTLTISGTGAIEVPFGTTAQRPTPAQGMIRFNTSTLYFEGYDGTSWGTFDDYKIQNSATDTTPGYLSQKLVAGTNMTITTNNSGANESISINWPFTAGTGISFASSQISLSVPVSIANGGTGQTTAPLAINALLPTQTGLNSSYYLNTNGSVASWSQLNLTAAVVVVLGTGSWTSDGGGYYHQNVAHNLNTNNTIQELYRADTLEMIRVNKITIIDANNIQVQTYGIPTFNVNVVVTGGASLSSTIGVEYNSGTSVPASILNFTGSGVAVSTTAGVSTVTISSQTILKSYTYYATYLDSPNTADWAVNALAPATADPTNSAVNVRQFSNTTEQGVGFSLNIPTGATNMTIKYRGRSVTASAATLQMKLYNRYFSSGAAISTWSTATLLTSVSVAANLFFTQYSQTTSLATLGLTAGNMYQFELTRNVAVAGNLAANWLMNELIVEFT